jgi:hypothetical protein
MNEQIITISSTLEVDSYAVRETLYSMVFLFIESFQYEN